MKLLMSCVFGKASPVDRYQLNWTTGAHEWLHVAHDALAHINSAHCRAPTFAARPHPMLVRELPTPFGDASSYARPLKLVTLSARFRNCHN